MDSPQDEQLMAVALWTSCMKNELTDPQYGQFVDNAVMTTPVPLAGALARFLPRGNCLSAATMP